MDKKTHLETSRRIHFASFCPTYVTEFETNSINTISMYYFSKKNVGTTICYVLKGLMHATHLHWKFNNFPMKPNFALRHR